MHQKCLKKDLEVIVDNFKCLEYIFKLFSLKNAIFREKYREFLCCTISLGKLGELEGSTQILVLR